MSKKVVIITGLGLTPSLLFSYEGTQNIKVLEGTEDIYVPSVQDIKKPEKHIKEKIRKPWEPIKYRKKAK